MNSFAPLAKGLTADSEKARPASASGGATGASAGGSASGSASGTSGASRAGSGTRALSSEQRRRRRHAAAKQLKRAEQRRLAEEDEEALKEAEKLVAGMSLADPTCDKICTHEDEDDEELEEVKMLTFEAARAALADVLADDPQQRRSVAVGARPFTVDPSTIPPGMSGAVREAVDTMNAAMRPWRRSSSGNEDTEEEEEEKQARRHKRVCAARALHALLARVEQDDHDGKKAGRDEDGTVTAKMIERLFTKLLGALRTVEKPPSDGATREAFAWADKLYEAFAENGGDDFDKLILVPTTRVVDVHKFASEETLKDADEATGVVYSCFASTRTLLNAVLEGDEAKALAALRHCFLSGNALHGCETLRALEKAMEEEHGVAQPMRRTVGKRAMVNVKVTAMRRAANSQ